MQRRQLTKEQILWQQVRTALLMVVDAIERYLEIETRTAELRRRANGHKDGCS